MLPISIEIMNCFREIVPDNFSDIDVFYEEISVDDILTDILKNGIIIIDKDGYILFFNNVAQKLTGYNQQYCIGKKISEIVSYINIESKDNLFHILGKPFNIIDISPIKYEDGEPNGYVIIFNNIIQIKETLGEIISLTKHVCLTNKKGERFRGDKIDPAFSSIIGKSDRFQHVLRLATKAAKTNSTILLKGESGTGKSLIAKAIHDASNRRKGPFVKVSCPAIPGNLVESELFGHEKGAFTGAINQRFGKFEIANGGTIFLDEIGELGKDTQAKMLRVIQEKEFERVGGNQTFNTDVRIIAATNRDLKEMVRQGDFREDLYYRLNVVSILLPSLRERKEDIPLLAQYFLNKLSVELGKHVTDISKLAMKYLVAYDWPGNIRELENIIERAINFTDYNFIDINVLPKEITGIDLSEKQFLINCDINGEVASFEDYEKEIIQIAMKKYKSFNAAGKVLGLTHKTVASKARKYGIV